MPSPGVYPGLFPGVHLTATIARETAGIAAARLTSRSESEPKMTGFHRAEYIPFASVIPGQELLPGRGLRQSVAPAPKTPDHYR